MRGSERTHSLVVQVWRGLRRDRIGAQAEAYATEKQMRRPEASGTKD
jgi:hypothetical protein